MITPTINGIRNLKNAGVFANIATGSFPHCFQKFNLIYGFNGCGKTTLSRLLGMLSEGRISDNLPENSEYSFLLTDGSTPSQDNPESPVRRLIAVFNEDYVERSLSWKEAAARPIIYLGKEQVQLAQRLAELETKEGNVNADHLSKSQNFSADERALASLCTSGARLIAAELGLGRSYDARNLKSDYQSQALSADNSLTEDDVKHIKATIARAELPDKIGPISDPLDGSVRTKVAIALKAVVSNITIETLQRRKDALQWVETGIHLHVDETECLFCANDLTKSRTDDLRKALQAGFEQFSQNLDEADAAAGQFLENCQQLEERLNRAIEPLPQHRASIEKARSVIRALCANGETMALDWRQQIAKKRSKPDEVLVTASLDESDWNVAIDAALTSLNASVSENDNALENFESERDQAKLKLKLHHLWQDKSGYDEAQVALEESRALFAAAESSLSNVRAEIDDLRSKLRTHGPAADQLNSLLQSYLGHSHISVEAVEEGYRICRDGKESKKPLSEGEKTAVAFCYFLTALNSEGRKIKDLIVVLDDPISSLDARAMTHVVSTVRKNFQSPAQLFVLTHNLDFMREMKKWLHPKNKKDQAPLAAFFFIETGILDGQRSSTIVELPRLIREYDSEYHYLYSLVKSLSDDPNGAEKFAYLMPNAIRKVLEIFVAFKVPGSGGLEPKLDNLIQVHTGLDGPRVKAMERLAHIESHSDNIGDVMTFSAYTLHQVADAAGCLMELIHELDPGHKRAMDRLCK